MCPPHRRSHVPHPAGLVGVTLDTYHPGPNQSHVAGESVQVPAPAPAVHDLDAVFRPNGRGHIQETKVGDDLVCEAVNRGEKQKIEVAYIMGSQGLHGLDINDAPALRELQPLKTQPRVEDTLGRRTRDLAGGYWRFNGG
jgi:hypothetical protein